MVAVMGLSSGRTTRKNTKNCPAPSIAAASSSSRGTPFTNPWYMNTASGAPSPQYIGMMPQTLPSFRSVDRPTIGTMMIWKGITMAKANSRYRSQESLPAVRASFQAAMELTMMMPATPPTVMRAVFSRARGNLISVHALAKFSSVIVVGGLIGRSLISASGFTALFRTNRAG